MLHSKLSSLANWEASFEWEDTIAPLGESERSNFLRERDKADSTPRTLHYHRAVGQVDLRLRGQETPPGAPLAAERQRGDDVGDAMVPLAS